MDRRQRRSRKAIFQAFSDLLSHRHYAQITVQDIIEQADISRSTFYAHFETKDMLLMELCCDIFDHIFAGEHCDYPQHSADLQPRLAHILWHLQQRKALVLGILASEGNSMFMHYFRQRLQALFSLHTAEMNCPVPPDFLLNHLVGSFTETVYWWAQRDMADEPEVVAQHFMCLLP